jgi:hypothetical protein
VTDFEIEYAYGAMKRIGYTPIGEQDDPAEYAKRFRDEEAYGFHIGSPDRRTVISLVLAIEAARCMCRVEDRKHVKGLLQRAIDLFGKDRDSDRIAVN